ncbi:hypothetical protein [Hyphomonas sp.]|uniref:hypothetical protein n=1 Tax=Hyphomonas sp. TaxID=87 RepID=UPI003529C884
MTAIFMLTLPASANMPGGSVSTFNQALQTGDAEIIVDAAKQFGATAIAHPEDEQAPIAAFEAGNQLCLWGACADAVPMADFLQEREGELPVSREQVDILSAFSKWSASEKDKAADAAFGEMLKARVASRPSALSLVAYETYTAAAVDARQWRKVRTRARLAAQHVETARDAVPKRWANLALMAVKEDYNQARSVSVLAEVAEIEKWLYQKLYVEGAGDLEGVYYTASAWRMAMHVSFRGSSKRVYARAEEIDKDVRKFQKDIEDSGQNGTPPLCSGHEAVLPSPTYPENAAHKGYVGAVLIGIDFVNGELVNYRILAAVPDGEFEQVSLEGMETLKWEWDEEQEYPGCRKTSSRPYVYPLVYAIQ